MTVKYSYSERAIADATNKLYKGTVDGKPAWSNAEILEIGTDSPFKRLKRIEWSPLKKDFQFLVNEAKKLTRIIASGATPTVIEHTRQKPSYGIRKIKCIRLSGNNQTVTIQEKYYNFFNARYPDCLFGIKKSSPSSNVVTVYDKKNILVGLIMPIFTA